MISIIALGTLLMGGCGGWRDAEPAPAPATAADARIREQVAARLAGEPSVRSGQIRVEARRGTVSLHGAVRGIGAMHCAIRNASLVAGVESVANFLVLERGPVDVTCLAPRDPPPARPFP